MDTQLKELKPPRKEIRALTGVRAFACLWVLVMHLSIFFPRISELVQNKWALAPVRQGFLGVDLFFLLSGFILSYNYARPGAMSQPRDYLRFLGLRIARIYPVHLFALVALVPLVIASTAIHGKWPEWAGLGTFVANLFLVNGWSFPVIASWNAPAWSVSAEWLAYLAFPGFAFLTAFVTSWKKAALMLAGCFAAFIGLCQLHAFPTSSSYGLLRIVFEFLAGCTLYRLYNTGFAGRFFSSWRAELVIVSALAAIYASAILFPGTMPRQAWCVPFLAVIIYALSWGGGRVARFLSCGVSEFGGRASYAIYMVQFHCMLLFVKPAKALSTSLPAEVALFFAFLAVIIIAGAIVHRWVEDPARIFLRDAAQRITRNWASRPRRTLAVQPASDVSLPE